MQSELVDVAEAARRLKKKGERHHLGHQLPPMETRARTGRQSRPRLALGAWVVRVLAPVARVRASA
jgi:hypothetical protein